MSAFDNPTPNLNNDESVDILRQSLPDSLYTLLKNKPVIFYCYGHYGYSWSMIVKFDSIYNIYSGRVGYLGGRYLNKKNESISIDTLRLISNNRSLISWGLDTISTEAICMRKVQREVFVTFSADLSVFNADGINTFRSDDAIAYSGPDSICFNKKYEKLCLIMRWLSDSKIRPYLPDSVIY